MNSTEIFEVLIDRVVEDNIERSRVECLLREANGKYTTAQTRIGALMRDSADKDVHIRQLKDDLLDMQAALNGLLVDNKNLQTKITREKLAQAWDIHIAGSSKYNAAGGSVAFNAFCKELGLE